jgi:hypothetical protein
MNSRGDNKQIVLHSQVVIGVFALIATLLNVGCSGKTSPNTTESTAPTLTWNVYNLNNSSSQDLNSNATINPWGNSAVRVTLKANDGGGVEQITLTDTRQWGCAASLKPSPLWKNQNGPFNDPTTTQNLPLDTNGMAVTSAFLITQPENPPWSCAPGVLSGPATTTFSGTSTNYANHQATATLTLSY